MTLNEIIDLAKKHARITYPSVLIAQALHESGLLTSKGASGLAIKYKNWFGIKGTYKGKATPKLDTAEFIDGKWIEIKDGFRWYETDAQSFEDREDLLDSNWGRSVYSRFHQAKTVEGQALGLQGVYATDPKYSDKLLAYIKQYNLKQYDLGFVIGKGIERESEKMGVTAQQFVNEALKLVGTKHGSSAYNQLVKDYNGNLSKVIAGGGLNPAPRNVGLSTDMSSGMYDWCAGFVSVVAVRLGIASIVGYEIAAERLGRQQHQSKGTWVGKVKPQVGDLVIFKWTNPTPGAWADHIGIVRKVDGNTFWVVEGNVGSPRSVSDSRSFSYLDARVLGFARPKFATAATPTPTPSKTIEEVAKEVIAGKWGNGDARKTQIVSAGYDYAKVQAKVNELASAKVEVKPTLKSIETIAKEVIAGKWHSGDKRKEELSKAGYDYHAVQIKVNELLQPDLTQVAKDVIAGKYGNGQARIDKLKAKSFDPQAVQAKVNELL